MKGLALPIQTERLILRDFVAADFDAVHAYASDPDVTRFMFFGPRDEAETREYLRRMLVTQIETPRMTWELAVIRRTDGRLIGACDLTLEDEREADLGYILAKDVWRQGYATEVASTLVRVGFEQLVVGRIFATCDINNTGSIRTLEGAGLRREALLEKHKEAKGRLWDSYLYAITRSEWERHAVA